MSADVSTKDDTLQFLSQFLPSGDVCLIGDVESGNEVLRLCPNGEIYVQGRLAANDQEVVDGMRTFLGLPPRPQLEAVPEPVAWEGDITKPETMHVRCFPRDRRSRVERLLTRVRARRLHLADQVLADVMVSGFRIQPEGFCSTLHLGMSRGRRAQRYLDLQQLEQNLLSVLGE